MQNALLLTPGDSIILFFFQNISSEEAVGKSKLLEVWKNDELPFHNYIIFSVPLVGFFCACLPFS